jgi:hypothetical protein
VIPQCLASLLFWDRIILCNLGWPWTHCLCSLGSCHVCYNYYFQLVVAFWFYLVLLICRCLKVFCSQIDNNTFVFNLWISVPVQREKMNVHVIVFALYKFSLF